MHQFENCAGLGGEEEFNLYCQELFIEYAPLLTILFSHISIHIFKAITTIRLQHLHLTSVIQIVCKQFWFYTSTRGKNYTRPLQFTF